MFSVRMQKSTLTLENRLTDILQCDPAILFPGIHSRETKTHIHPETCPRIFMGDLFVIAQKWKQSKRPSMGEWKNNL